MAHALDDVTPLTWRTGRVGDLDALVTLSAAVDYVDDPAESYEADEIRAYVDRSGPGVLDRLLLGWEGDSLVAMAWNVPVVGAPSPEVRLVGAVHPAYRHQGIGRRLLAEQWSMAVADHAREAPGRPLRLVAYADEKLAAKRRLYVRAGMAESRRFLDMHVRLADVADRLAARLAGPVPAGVRYVPWDEALCESCRDAHNEAFAESWHARPVSHDSWHDQTRRPAARPQWSWLAVDDDDRVVGYALNSVAEGDSSDGWTDRLGVRPSHRGLGIATDLLARSLDSFARAGAQDGGLGLDSRGAPTLDLYRSLGYEASDTIIQYAHEVAYADDLAADHDSVRQRRDGDR